MEREGVGGGAGGRKRRRGRHCGSWATQQNLWCISKLSGRSVIRGLIRPDTPFVSSRKELRSHSNARAEGHTIELTLACAHLNRKRTRNEFLLHIHRIIILLVWINYWRLGERHTQRSNALDASLCRLNWDQKGQEVINVSRTDANKPQSSLHTNILPVQCEKEKQ